ncbi:MAG TPA: RHS repeat-associated core domain-containing protein [Trinickia sp.]|uniref:RHS repeat-associated core domain-containing protein n=1 Tax=Trinickia sp. TaxID=2571163 RepID=UPI002CBC9CEC|nr:RHS repeat-associated core domain-containing protein [Trinickia sp.]HVW50469.1 RHS repeat-associated core domain-containing protein [Trinickia sp.]
MRLQGQQEDAETGLAYTRNRYYDPSSGRFISTDPIGLHGGSNHVRPYNELKNRSTPGDKLDIHHPMQSNPASQVAPGYDHQTAPAIAIPKAKHLRIPTIKGTYAGTARDLLAKDIRDPRNRTTRRPWPFRVHNNRIDTSGLGGRRIARIGRGRKVSL